MGGRSRKDLPEVSALRALRHDIANPLAVVGMNVAALRSRISQEDAEALEIIDDIEGGLEELERLIKQIDDGPVLRGVLDPASPVTVDEVERHIERVLRSQIDIGDNEAGLGRRATAPESIVTHPVAFFRVIDNLLSNAAKYTRRGHIRVELGGDGSGLTVKIADSGDGITEERLEQVLGTTHRGEGRLGLSNVVRLVAALDGQLDLQTQPGIGTTVWVRFPPRVAAREGRWSSEPLQSLVHRVVTIRPVASKK